MALQRIELDSDVAMEIAFHEALIRQAYKDSVGRWTWSIGLTSATGHKVERYIGKPQPLQKCIDVYVWALRRYAKQVLEAFEGYHLTKPQFAAALSFHWNTGAIKRASWVYAVKRGDMAKARTQFMWWDNPPEIRTRRKAERDLFFDAKWSNNGTMIEYTRVTSRGTPVWSSAKRIEIIEEIYRAMGGIPVAIMNPQETPQPYAPVEVPTLTPSAVVDKPYEPVYNVWSFWQTLKRWFQKQE